VSDYGRRWEVWRVTYATYDEVEVLGDIKPVRVLGGLTLEDAKRRADELGFGHCVKPEPLVQL
jgi:hypothetical protein